MAVAYVAQGNFNGQAGATSKTYSVTCSGLNRILIVFTAVAPGVGSVSPTSVTYNGVSLTQLGSVSGGSSIINMWYLLNPDTGANNVTVTYSAATAWYSWASQYSGVASIGNFNSQYLAAGGPGSITTAFTSTYNNLIVDGLFYYANVTPTSSQTVSYSYGSSNGQGSSYGPTGASSTSVTWTAGTNAYAHVGAELVSVPSTNFTGFEQGGILSSNGGDDYQPFQVSGGTGAVDTTRPKHGTYCALFSKTGANTSFMDFPILRTSNGDAGINVGSFSEIYIQFYFNCETRPSTTFEQFMEITNTAGNPIAFLAMNSSGKILIYDFNNYGSPVLKNTSTATIAINTWYKISFKIVAGSSGSYELKVDDTADVSGSASWTLTQNIRRFNIGIIRNQNSESLKIYFDDVVGNDKEYPFPTGEYAVGVLNPDSNGSTMQWTSGTGASDYTQVDEIPFSDADYVMSTGSANNVALFNFESLSTAGISTTNVKGVKAVAIMRKDSGSGTQTKIRVRSGGTNYDVVDTANLGGATNGFAQCWPIDPSTNSVWTTSAVDAFEAGAIEIGANQVRMVSALTYVLYEVNTITVNAGFFIMM